MNILIDPYILAVPSDSSQISDYLENLFEWLTAVSSDTNHYWLSSEVVNALLKSKIYPTWEALQEIEQQASEHFYNANTLLRACEPQLMEPPLLDELFNNSIYYFEDEAVAVIPPQIDQRLPETVSKALKKTLALAAIGNFFQLDDVFEDLAFATTSAEFSVTQLDVKFEVSDLDKKADQAVSFSLDMLFSPNEVDEMAGLVSFWDHAARACHFVHRKIYQNHQSPPPLPVIEARPSFYESLEHYQMPRQSAELYKIYRKIVMGLTGDIKRNQIIHHPLQRNDQDLRIGSATAWRLWIEHSTPGWRVHYWLYQDGSVELAKFVPHDDMRIPDPAKEAV
jgi:hypothetical protein